MKKEEKEVIPVGSIIDPMEAWNANKQTYCCAAKHGVLYFPTWGKGSSCTFQSESGTVLRDADNNKITGHNTYRSLCQAVLAVKAQDTFVCYTQSREAYELFIKAHVSKEKQQELLKELPGVDMTEQQELPPGSVIEVNSYKSADVLMRTVPPNSTTEPLPPAEEVQEIVPVKPKGTVTSVAVGKDTTAAVTLRLVTDGPGSSWGVGTPTEFPATDINGKPLLSDTFKVTASPDSQPLTAESHIKTMKSGVTPQPSRSRIGKIAARPYEYVYDGPEQMGTTFVSRYRIDDEVWTRVGHELVKMKVTGIYVDGEKGKTTYRYGFGNTGKPENECYDTLFDLISEMTRISVEDLIAAAKEVE